MSESEQKAFNERIETLKKSYRQLRDMRKVLDNAYNGILTDFASPNQVVELLQTIRKINGIVKLLAVDSFYKFEHVSSYYGCTLLPNGVVRYEISQCDPFLQHVDIDEKIKNAE